MHVIYMLICTDDLCPAHLYGRSVPCSFVLAISVLRQRYSNTVSTNDNMRVILYMVVCVYEQALVPAFIMTIMPSIYAFYTYDNMQKNL